MNSVIATGHVMRCLAVADAAKKLNKDTTFILADNCATDILTARGYSYIVLNTQWDDMESEIDILEKLIKDEGIKTLLVDSYMVTPKYLSELKKMVKTVYIDDLNSFNYPVDAVICYANYYKKFKYENNYRNVELLLGTQYAPLREEFVKLEEKIIKPNVENLLLLSGGADPYDVLRQLLNTIDVEVYKRIDVICGKYYQNFEKLLDRYRQSKKIYIHKAVDDMWNYMKKADIVVSAGGTTLYELCACGTPVISYSLADNQLGNVLQFDEEQIIDYVGDVRDSGTIFKIDEYLRKYYSDEKLRSERSKKMRQVVDGKGAERIAKYLLS